MSSDVRIRSGPGRSSG